MRKYEEIVEYITKEYINKYNLRHNKLPSIRQIASTKNCSKNSVIRALKELEDNHKIYCIPQSGYYIVDAKKNKVFNNEIIDMAKSNPDARALPYREFTHCSAKAVEKYKDMLFTYPDVQGLLSFREALKDLFAKRQVYVNTEEICVTSGIQQSISILLQMAGSKDAKNNTILLEKPGYMVVSKIAEKMSWNIKYIDRTEDGLSVSEIEIYFKNYDIRYFYIMPRFHNPTGHSLSEKNKMQIVKLCEKYNVYLIEDDYLAELDYVNSRLPMHYYDTKGKVIYLAGFSKSFMPGIRIGAVCMPRELLSEFLKMKYLTDIGTSAYLQGTMEIFITNGMYDRHRKKIVKIYSEKMNLCKKIYENYKDSISADTKISESGYYIWIKFRNMSSKKDLELLVSKLMNKNVLVSSGKQFYPIEEDKNDYAIRICISSSTKEKLEDGIRRVFEYILGIT